MEEKAHLHLLSLVDHLRVPSPGHPPDEALSLQSLSSALAALRATEAITEEEAHEWTNRMLVALGREPLTPLPSGGSGTRLIAFSDGARRPPAPPEPLATFLRMVPVRADPVDVGFGGRFQVLGVELYDTRVAVNWRVAPIPDAELAHADALAQHDRDSEGLDPALREVARQQLVRRLSHPHIRLALHDDQGTSYHPGGSGSSGSGTEWVGHTSLHPGAPTAARVLTVVLGDVSIPVELDG